MSIVRLVQGSAKPRKRLVKQLVKLAVQEKERVARVAKGDPIFAAWLTQGSRFRPLQDAAVETLQGLAVRPGDEIMADAAAGLGAGEEANADAVAPVADADDAAGGRASAVAWGSPRTSSALWMCCSRATWCRGALPRGVMRAGH